METTNQNSEYPEIGITSSWVLLSSDEEPKVPEKVEDLIGEILETEKNKDITEEHKAPFFEDVVQNINDTNNKSDGESDGISIISESEFYMTRSDDEFSTNSSDENIVDNLKNMELPKNNHLDELLESHENHSDVEILPSLNTDIDDMTQHEMTDSNILTESNTSNVTEPDYDKTNFESENHDGKSTNKELINYFKTIFKFNSMCFIGTLVLAITVSYFSSILTQDGSLNQKNMQNDDQNEMTNDRIVNIYEYGGDIYECTSFNHDNSDEECIRRNTKDIKQTKKLKPPEIKTSASGKSKKLDPNIQETEISSDKYDNIKHKEEIECKNKKKFRNKKYSDSYRKVETNERKYENQKKYSEITEEKLLQEKEKIENWRDTLTKEEERLKEWEKKLLEIEKKLYERKKNQNILYASSENKNKYKKFKNKETVNNMDELKSDRFNDKRDFKKNRSGGKKIDVPINSPNQKTKRFKDKYMHKMKIPVTDDDKLKNFRDVYSQRRNQTAAFDDNNTITGEWYLNLLRARNEKRQKGDKAGWWFERANFRKTKRNKAYWYFQYMFNREDLRYISSQNARNV